MFLKFYREPGNDIEKLAQKFAEAVSSCGKKVSPAQIQGFFMFFKNNPEEATRNVSQMWQLL